MAACGGDYINGAGRARPDRPPWRERAPVTAKSAAASAQIVTMPGLKARPLGGGTSIGTETNERCGAKQSYVFPAWKQSCDAVVKWDGTKFTYKPL